MEKFILHDEIRIKGKICFEGLRYEYFDKEHGEILEFKFTSGNELTYLRFYSGIISFRHREVNGAENYKNMQGDTNSNDKIYVVEESSYIRELNLISNGAVYDSYSPLTHYVVFDYELEYYFDVVTNSTPEIVICLIGE